MNKSIIEAPQFVDIIWSDDISSQDIAEIISEKFDVSTSYFVDDDGNFGITIPKIYFNKKIESFLTRKVNIIKKEITENKKSFNESKRIMFGNDIIKLLEKYGLNKLWEVPTKYKEGYTTIDFAYSYVPNIDKLKTTVDYIEFTVDEETDGFIDGMMYLNKNGDYESIEVKFIEDVKYFIENSTWEKF